jgi:hypothetical protein
VVGEVASVLAVAMKSPDPLAANAVEFSDLHSTAAGTKSSGPPKRWEYTVPAYRWNTPCRLRATFGPEDSVGTLPGSKLARLRRSAA